MKIFLTGNSGSGKSTLGRRLSESLNLPLYGLDKIVWKPDWVPTPKEERAHLIASLVVKEDWIIEGVSKQVLEAADRVIFLDLPLWRCLLNIGKRSFFNGPGTRADLPENCPEYIGFFKSVRIAFLYQKITRPWLMSELGRPGLTRITRYEELEDISFGNDCLS